MDMTTMLLALVAWLVISCAIAWGVGRASELGQDEANSVALATDERRMRTERRASNDRRTKDDRRMIERDGFERRIMDRRLMQRRVAWTAPQPI